MPRMASLHIFRQPRPPLQPLNCHNHPLWTAAFEIPPLPLHFLHYPPPRGLSSGHFFNSGYACRFKKALSHSTSSVSADTRNGTIPHIIYDC